MTPIASHKGAPAPEHIDNLARLGTPKRAAPVRKLNRAAVRELLDRINCASGSASIALQTDDALIIEDSLRAAEYAIKAIRAELDAVTK